MPGPVFLHGETVTLHVPEADDAAFVARGRDDPDVRPWLPQSRPQTVGETADELAEPGGGDTADVRLLVCVDGTPVGVVSMGRLDNDDGRADVGAWVRPESQGAGYGSDALRRLIRYGFEDRRLNRIGAAARADNGASRAMLESLGFVQEGRQREVYYLDGRYVDRVVYGLLASEWRSR